jgi:hypothetical protein
MNASARACLIALALSSQGAGDAAVGLGLVFLTGLDGRVYAFAQ